MYLNFSALRSNNDADYTVNLRVPVNHRIISKYSSNRVISILTLAVRSRTRAIIDSLSRRDSPRARSSLPILHSRSCSFTALLRHLISPSQSPPVPSQSPRFLPSSYLFGNSARIRGISYLAQIQSYEYNFPREQSFIVIVNPSVNCPALSITAVRYNSVLSPSLPSFQPPRPTVTTIRRLRFLAVIHRG